MDVVADPVAAPVSDPVFVSTSSAGGLLFEATFTGPNGQNLNAYTPEIPAGGLVNYGSQPMQINNNVLSLLGAGSGGEKQIRWSLGAGAPSEFSVSADITMFGVGSDQGPGITAAGTGTPYREEYHLVWFNDRFYLEAYNGSGGLTSLGEHIDPSISNGTVYNLRIDLTATEVIAFVDGVEIFRVTNSAYRGGVFGWIAYSTGGLADGTPIMDDLEVE